MTVWDEIFPSERNEAFVQTEWASGWGYGVIGFGEAARLLTAQRQKMGASVDQVGLAVFYLQRHRVELVIKQALVDLGDDPIQVAELRHNLRGAWHRLEVRVRSIDPMLWQSFSPSHLEFLSVMHRADEGSFSYRYPIDRKGDEVARVDFINLEALESHAEAFESGVQGISEWLSERQSEEPEVGY